MPSANQIRTLEFFAGIGGFAVANRSIGEPFHIAAALDINRPASEVYLANFNHPYWVREIDSIPIDQVRGLQADLWWMSPPCQPFTSRGLRRDIDDPRCGPLLRMIEWIGAIRPKWIAMENVVGFAESIARNRLVEQLELSGYLFQETLLCPTALGWPNRRPRYYLLASHGQPLPGWKPIPVYQPPLASMIDDQDACDLILSESLVANVLTKIDRIERRRPRATACFASSYGQTMLASGSYLQTHDGRYRRFSPREVANLLGFPPDFELPTNWPHRRLWKLLGNSLSIPVVSYILEHIAPGMVWQPDIVSKP